MARIILGVTGASGAIYADRLAQLLLEQNHELHLIQTDLGKQVCRFEGHHSFLDKATYAWKIDDLFAGCASGSWSHDGMVIVPCSMGSLGKIAHGISDNLLVRAADVCIKEKRKLIVVPREMPMSIPHLENQLRLAQWGVTILPANPFFYHHPKTLEDVVDSVVARIMEHLGLSHNLRTVWLGPQKQPTLEA